ncbi:MAG: response regulator [Atribacterota bacterium]|nr:response regulator [Atribacterota bacterium]MDD4896873.1 response regulator [Atribacterota bacterium]MDD5637073.1 response regulator [Atribacterota bacterium]
MTKKQILIVDGDVMQAERLKRNLELENYIVDVMYHGTEAIVTLKRKWVDLIISSITLQGTMNGIQLLQEIKKHKEFSKIPVIITSSKINLEKTIYDIGATLFIEKPYDIFELVKKIKYIFPE